MADAAVLDSFLTALPLPTLAIDRHERIIAANDAAEKLLGHGTLGRPFVTVLRQPVLVEAVESTLADGQPRSASFVQGAAQSETSYSVSLMRMPEDGPLIISFQDVTSQAQAGQMRRDFVANVSHELRTPLTSLIGFIETLSGPARDDAPARERFLAIMSKEAERMNRLVGDLLSLSRVEAEERVKPTARIDLRDVLRTALRNLNPLAVEKEVTLVPQLGNDPMPVVGDADQLLQVFTNLIENALKYGKTGGRVEIAASMLARDRGLRGPALRIDVRDDGPGIDPVHLPRLTERFYRADTHRSRALGGTGLGLAIVKHILNRHKGRLQMESQSGQGACFSVILPTAAPPT